jgi:hypothetical protein
MFLPQTPLAGNPLAVFTDARGLTDKQMQGLAHEMNLSETTFILPREPEVEKETNPTLHTNTRVKTSARVYCSARRARDRRLARWQDLRPFAHFAGRPSNQFKGSKISQNLR